MGMACAAGLLPGSAFATGKRPSDLYEVPSFGNVSLLHITPPSWSASRATPA